MLNSACNSDHLVNNACIQLCNIWSAPSARWCTPLRISLSSIDCMYIWIFQTWDKVNCVTVYLSALVSQLAVTTPSQWCSEYLVRRENSLFKSTCLLQSSHRPSAALYYSHKCMIILLMTYDLIIDNNIIRIHLN